jgi:hypothetical protein
VVPFADFWLIVNEALFGQPPRLAPAVSALRQRWSAILDLPPPAAASSCAADLRERVASHFPARPLPWPVAMHHSPDLMIAGAQAAAGGPLTWVLGEVHPSLISSRYATWLALHDDPEAVRAAARHDLGAAVVWLAETAENGGARTRLSNVLASPGDLARLRARLLRLRHRHRPGCRRVRRDRLPCRASGAAPRRNLRG